MLCSRKIKKTRPHVIQKLLGNDQGVAPLKIEKLANSHFMFVDRYAIHIQYFVDSTYKSRGAQNSKQAKTGKRYVYVRDFSKFVIPRFTKILFCKNNSGTFLDLF